MNAKPADFFFGLVDFFAVLMPGILSTYLIKDWGVSLFGNMLPVFPNETSKWIAFLVASYVIGHLLHHLGSFIDKSVYDNLYIKWMRRKGEEKLLVKTRAIMKDMLGDDSDMTSAFSWAGSYVRVRSDEAARELDRGGADSKFFRSLAIVAFIAVFIFTSYALIVAILLLFFSLLRYCDRRWKNCQLTYEYFVLLSKVIPPKQYTKTSLTELHNKANSADAKSRAAD